MVNQDDLQFGRTAVRLGLIEARQLANCLQLQKELSTQGQNLHLLQIFINKGYLNQEQVETVMQASASGEYVPPTIVKKTLPSESPPYTQINVTQNSNQIETPCHFAPLRDEGKTKTKSMSDENFPQTKIRKNAPLEQYLGRYQILQEIGRGGMGRVYKAHDTHLDRTVAIKRLIADDDADSVARFLREAKATAKLDNPNIVKVYEMGQEEGQYFFIMDFVEGSPLSNVIQKGSLTTRQIVDIMIKVGNAIHYAHTQGIIHRDLKPGNVMIGTDGEPKVMDFGLAKIHGESSKLSQSGVVIGTLQYMPPEQAEGKMRAIDAVSDVYSLGGILYEMLTGKAPFSGTTFSQVLEQVLHKDPTPPTQLKHRTPKPLEDICLKALAKEKSERYPTALAFVQDLQRFSQGQKIKGSTIRLKKRTLQKILKDPKKLTIIGSMILFLLVIVIVGISSRSQKKNKHPQQQARHNQSPSQEKKVTIPPKQSNPTPQEPKQPDKPVQTVPANSLSMSAKLVNQAKNETNNFIAGEPIYAEVLWETTHPVEEKGEIEIYGDKVKYNKYSLPQSHRKYHCPLELLGIEGEVKSEMTLQLTVGRLSCKKSLQFTVQPKSANSQTETSIMIKLIGTDGIDKRKFLVGEQIFLELDWGDIKIPPDITPRVELSGEHIQRKIYKLQGNKKKHRCPVLLENKNVHGILKLTLRIIVGEQLCQETVAFVVVPDVSTKIAFEIEHLKLFDLKGNECSQLKRSQEFQLKVTWNVTQVPEGVKQTIEFSIKDNAAVFRHEDPDPVAKKQYELTLKLVPNQANISMPGERMEATARITMGGISKEQTVRFPISDSK